MDAGPAAGAGGGAAGVDTAAEEGAGVDGTAGLAAAFGFTVVSIALADGVGKPAYLLSHADDEPLLFDLIRFDGIIILQDLACE